MLPSKTWLRKSLRSSQRPTVDAGALLKTAFTLMVAGMLAACGGGDAPQGGSVRTEMVGTGDAVVTVFAAASLKEAFEEISQEFEALHPGSEIRLNFDGSQRLSLQLRYGADAEVFASADQAQMEALKKAGMLDGEASGFAHNELVLLVNSGMSGERLADPEPELQSSDQAFRSVVAWLAEPGRKIVIGSTESPIGAYSDEALDKLAEHPDFGRPVADAVSANVVSRETSVRGVAQKVALGEADAGITYRTDALLEGISDSTFAVDIPVSLNVVAQYPIIALDDSEPAKAFVDFVLSDQGKSILETHGFGTGQGSTRTGR